MSRTWSRGLDMEPLKSIPGYQAILKAVLKSQIQFLVEQLSEQTGEESVLLTASLSDGTLTHLGSSCGEYFLQDHEEFKSQFLGFCLQRQFKRKSEYEPMKSANERPASYKRHKSVDDVFTVPSSVVKDQSDMLLRAPLTSTCLNRRKSSYSSEQFSDNALDNSNVLKENKEKTFVPGNDCKIPQDFAIGTDIEKGDFVGTDDKSQDIISAGIEGGADDHNIIVKQEPENVSDSTTPSIDTFTESERSSFNYTSIQQYYGCGKNSRRPQPHVRLSKTSVMSPTAEQFGDSANTGMSPMLSDYYLREVLSQITTKTGQLTELNAESGLPVTVPTGDKPFRCHLCGRGFTQRGNLEVHMWTQHGNK